MAAEHLNAQHPSVGAALDDVASARLVEMASKVAAAAVTECGIASDCERAGDPFALVESLDEAAWDAQSQGDDATYQRTFRRARAADAWARAGTVADREAAADVLYEAIHALGGDAAAEAMVIRLMRT